MENENFPDGYEQPDTTSALSSESGGGDFDNQVSEIMDQLTLDLKRSNPAKYNELLKKKIGVI